jgi:tRNA (adenine22-N1)-methyltransferase
VRIKLDDRLAAIAGLVLPGYPAADIGTDHGYLPVYLVQNRICPLAVASDKARAPYENACQLVKALDLEPAVSVRQGEGLEVLKPGETATIIIAGIGGMLICHILDASSAIMAKTIRVVLQPQKDADQLRQWLAMHRWRIVGEAVAYENGFYYPVIAAEHGRMTLTEDEAVFGPCLLKEPSPLFLRYLEFKLAQAEALIRQLGEYPGTKTQMRLRACRIQAQKIRDILEVTSEKLRWGRGGTMLKDLFDLQIIELAEKAILDEKKESREFKQLKALKTAFDLQRENYLKIEKELALLDTQLAVFPKQIAELE